MCKSCFDGFMTEGCSKCEFWRDGTDEFHSTGCAYPGPIMHCEDFAKHCEKNERVQLQEDEEECVACGAHDARLNMRCIDGKWLCEAHW
jgi:hypothetical protein